MRLKLVTLFYRLFAFFPFFIAAILGLSLLFSVTDPSKYALPVLSHRLFAFVLACVLLALIGVVIHTRKFFNASKLFKFAVLPGTVALGAFLLRLVYFYAFGFQLEPFSDFGYAYQSALGSAEYAFRYAIFPSWGGYACFLKALMGLLSGSYQEVQIINAIFVALTTVLLYHLALLLTKNERIALCAAVLMAVSPTSIAYTALLSPEIPAVFLLVLTTLFLLLGARAKTWGAAIAFFACSGFLLGIIDYLKPIAPIALIALALVFLFFDDPLVNLKVKFLKPNASSITSLLSKLTKCLFALVLVYLCFSGMKAISKDYIESSFEITTSENVIPHFLFVGLAHDGEGQCHIGEYSGWDLEVYEENQYDFDTANATIMEHVKDDLGSNLDNLPRLLVQKIIWAWQDDICAMYYVQLQDGVLPYLPTFASLGQSFYILLMLFAGIGCLIMARRGKENSGLFLVSAMVFGFALVLLIGEAQSRYKIMIMPFIFLISALGIQGTAAFFVSKLKNRRRSQSTDIGFHKSETGS